MRSRRSAIRLLFLAALAVGACRTVAPPTPLPADWRTLVAVPAPFSALYRLSCCGHRDLVLVAHADGEKLSISITVPPGGPALVAWMDGSGGWMSRGGEGCREPLAEDVLPLSAKVAVPLEPELAARLLSGLLPERARESAGSPGWVESASARWWERARVEGPEPRCARVVVGRPGNNTPVLTADLADLRGHVPGKLLLQASGVKAELVLKEWREGGAVSPPGWLGQPICPDRS